MMNEMQGRQSLVRFGASLYKRGFAVGSAGNMSLRLDDGSFLATPTGSSLGFLEEADIAHVDGQGNLLGGSRPTKELFFHLACFRMNPRLTAVVHLHSTYATLLASCEGLSDGVPIKPFTPYFVMKIGAVGILPYRKPGDMAIASDILAKPGYSTYLLANHGLIVCGKTLADAVQAAEEFEETAKLWYLGTSLPIRYLSDAEISELRP